MKFSGVIREEQDPHELRAKHIQDFYAKEQEALLARRQEIAKLATVAASAEERKGGKDDKKKEEKKAPKKQQRQSKFKALHVGVKQTWSTAIPENEQVTVLFEKWGGSKSLHPEESKQATGSMNAGAKEFKPNTNAKPFKPPVASKPFVPAYQSTGNFQPAAQSWSAPANNAPVWGNQAPANPSWNAGAPSWQPK